MSKVIEIGEDFTSAGLVKITLVNPSDKSWTKHRYILSFGAYGWTRLMVWANSVGDALDEASAQSLSNSSFTNAK